MATRFSNRSVALGVVSIAFGGVCPVYYYWGYTVSKRRLDEADSYEMDLAQRVNWNLAKYPLFAYKPDTCMSVRASLRGSVEAKA